LVYIVEDKQLVSIVRPCKPFQNVPYHNIKVVLVAYDAVPTPLWDLALGDPVRTASDALSQPVFRPAVQPED